MLKLCCDGKAETLIDRHQREIVDIDGPYNDDSSEWPQENNVGLYVAMKNLL